MFGGIDLGGTKIEACLHDGRFNAVQRGRRATPRNYADLIDALADQVGWLRRMASDDTLPVGIGIPGLVDHTTGFAYTANLDAMHRPLAADLAERIGEVLRVENDCKCFALSEANGGAGAGPGTMFGLIIGTGVGGGVCVDGRLLRGWTGLPGEVGHIGIPALLLNNLRLPAVTCGCGRTGCYETYLSGPGLSRLAAAIVGAPLTGEAITAGITNDAPGVEEVLRAWSQIAAELIHTLQLTMDPELVVLGGGVTLIPGVPERITRAFEKIKLAPTRVPKIIAARFGDSSGVRGAAMLAHPSLSSLQFAKEPNETA